MHKIYGRERAKQRSGKEERKSQHTKFYVIPHKTDEIWAEKRSDGMKMRETNSL
jgi:hypothetical protein